MMSNISSSSVAAFLVELPADRFVEELFPTLAWSATVRLGDPAIGSRLVERVLVRAWEERDRFATPESLYQHVRLTAKEAIEREADRRLDSIRFDESLSLPLPGSLLSMSMESVQRRLQDRPRRDPAAIPQAPPTTPQAPPTIPQASPMLPVSALPAQVAPAPVAPITTAAALVAPTAPVVLHQTPVVRASIASEFSPRSPTVAKWAAKSHTVSPDVAPESTGTLSRATPARPHLRGADYITQREGKRLPPRLIGAIAGVAVVAVVVAWRVASASPPAEQALAALGDTSGVSGNTTRAEKRDVMLPGGSSVHLGPEAVLRSSKDFATGARALHLSGPAAVSVKVDSARPMAIAAGPHRWMTYGVKAAFDSDGTRSLVHVDSGALELVSDSVRVTVSAGNAVGIDADGRVKALSAIERNAAFAWESGRLTLTRVPVQRMVDEVSQWFGLTLRYKPARGAADSLSIDVPLDSPDSLIAAIGAAVGDSVERDGTQLTVRPATARSLTPTKVARSGSSARRSRPTLRADKRKSDAPIGLRDLKLPDITLPNLTTKPPVNE